MNCTQPGCTGTIVDGYCTVCGTPGSGGGSSPGTIASAAGLPPSNQPPSLPPRGQQPDGAATVFRAPTGANGSAGIPGPGRPPHSGPLSQRQNPVDGGQRRAAQPASTGSGPPRGAHSGCQQPGCNGRVTDGYCNVCGAPAGGGPPRPDESGSDAGDVPSARTQSSTRLESAAIGSRRAASSGSVATRRTGTGSVRLRSGRLGAGLTRVPPAPSIDAAAAVMKDPSVPENKRTCPSCGSPVGRSRDGHPGRTTGFCPQCRNPYSFDPKLTAGELVANQYEVMGCLAHGGLGWVYLAKDRNVSDRWVVLKGLLNSGDPDALAAAIAEQQFLAQVEHPLIVEIYNFVTYEGAGYIVMEYVGGRSLKQLLKQRMRANNGVYAPLPPDQALAYILEVLPAFSYLHDLGLVYCDFKPDNLIQVGDALKLIDLGGVRRIDDDDSAIYGTVGYQAPEVPDLGPSIASDIYTIGRTLLVLAAEFRGYQGRYRDSLPGVDQVPLFQQYDSLHRMTAKACAPDPADRFQTADELREQLLGVLREVVASHTEGTALTSASSVLFESPAVASNALEWSQLPSLRADTTDPQHAWLSNVSVEDPQEQLAALARAPEFSAEVQIARASAALELGQTDLVHRIVDEMLTIDPWEWRAVWLAGLVEMQRKNWQSAQSSFNAVYGQVPGELAPKLALAVSCEYGGQGGLAERLYRACASTDANYVAAAAFGLARVRHGRGDVAGAVAALDLVPTTSRGYTQSRRLRAEHLLTANAPGLEGLKSAYASIENVRLDPIERHQLTVHILERALAIVHTQGDSPDQVGPWQATDAGLRTALEESYRVLARNAPDRLTRNGLVDRANLTRKWSLT